VVHRIKLRGDPSFGLVILPELGMEVGADVAEFYEAKKYNPPIKIQIGDSKLYCMAKFMAKEFRLW
jgi:hypothetical protein